MSRRMATHGQPRSYPRTARVNELLREIVAEELERIDDDRLELVTITAVDVDPDLEPAPSSTSTRSPGARTTTRSLEALDEHRVAAAGGRRPPGPAPSARRELEFRPDRRRTGAHRRACGARRIDGDPSPSSRRGRRRRRRRRPTTEAATASRRAVPTASLVVDKPAGLDVATTSWPSSRGVLGTRKVGHAGTLDPDATGVLLLGVGRVTRLLRFLTALPQDLRRARSCSASRPPPSTPPAR